MQVKADEQAAIAAAAHAQAQAEAQAELHRQLQQRLADAQAASAAQEAEKEKRKVQTVTLKGARLAFNAPKAAAKPAATPPPGKHGLVTTHLSQDELCRNLSLQGNLGSRQMTVHPSTLSNNM